MQTHANMHDLNTNNNDLHKHIYDGCTASYENMRLITNMFKLEIAKFVSTLEFVVKSPSIRVFGGKFSSITYISILKLAMYIVALYHTFNDCKQMYVDVRLHTTNCTILWHDVQQCTIKGTTETLQFVHPTKGTSRIKSELSFHDRPEMQGPWPLRAVMLLSHIRI